MLTINASKLSVKQLEFVVQLLAGGNTVIALARNPASAKSLLAIKDKNLHILKADITNAEEVKVLHHF